MSTMARLLRRRCASEPIRILVRCILASLWFLLYALCVCRAAQIFYGQILYESHLAQWNYGAYRVIFFQRVTFVYRAVLLVHFLSFAFLEIVFVFFCACGLIFLFVIAEHAFSCRLTYPPFLLTCNMFASLNYLSFNFCVVVQ